MSRTFFASIFACPFLFTCPQGSRCFLSRLLISYLTNRKHTIDNHQSFYPQEPINNSFLPTVTDREKKTFCFSPPELISVNPCHNYSLSSRHSDLFRHSSFAIRNSSPPFLPKQSNISSLFSIQKIAPAKLNKFEQARLAKKLNGLTDRLFEKKPQSPSFQ